MKKILLLLFLFFVLIPCGFCNATDQGTIVFYREPGEKGVNELFYVALNGSLVVRLNENAFFSQSCDAGVQNLKLLNYPGVNVDLNVHGGKTYYVCFSTVPKKNSYTTRVSLVDSAQAESAIRRGNMRNLNLNRFIVQPSHRFGLQLQFGTGLVNTPMQILSSGVESNFTFAGGFGGGFSFGYELMPRVELGMDMAYQYKTFSRDQSTSKMSFNRWIFSLTPSYIFPILGKETLNLRLGAGVDAYLGNSLNMESSQLADGYNDIYYYKTALGGHVSSYLDYSVSEQMTFSIGLKVYQVNYVFKDNALRSPVTGEVSTPNGSGMDVLVGFNYRF